MKHIHCVRTMPIFTVPNQKIVHIHRDIPHYNEGYFLTVKKQNFADAYRDLNATGFVLWLYFASNKDGFDLALSPQAVNLDLGMPLSTCRDQIKLLINKGYLIQHSEGSNIYDFYERPRTPSANQSECRNLSTPSIREIDKKEISKTNNIEWRF